MHSWHGQTSASASIYPSSLSPCVRYTVEYWKQCFGSRLLITMLFGLLLRKHRARDYPVLIQLNKSPQPFFQILTSLGWVAWTYNTRYSVSRIYSKNRRITDSIWGTRTKIWWVMHHLMISKVHHLTTSSHGIFPMMIRPKCRPWRVQCIG